MDNQELKFPDIPVKEVKVDPKNIISLQKKKNKHETVSKLY